MAAAAKGQLNFMVLPSATKKALEYLSKQIWLKDSDWYLAGGTALALQAGHRSSVDLDFFTQKTTFSAAKLISYLPQNILKSLTYFDDAEHDPMPKLFFKASWKEIKTFFQKEVTAIGKKLYM